MSRYEAIIRYDGPALAGHKMDVDDIAPALLALADLCRRANALANESRAGVQLNINLDVEQHCAQVGLEIVQTFLDRAQTFLDDGRVATAQDLFQWIGIVVVGPAVGLFGILKLLRGRKPDSTSMTVVDGRHYTQITVAGDVILAHPRAVELLADPIALRKAKDVVKPASKIGYEIVEFLDKGRAATQVSREEAVLIEATPSLEGLNPTKTTLPESRMTIGVKIKKAVYAGTGQWSVVWDKTRDVAFEDIEWLTKFQANEIEAPPGTVLTVRMRVSAIEPDEHNEPIREPSFAIEKVLDVSRPPKQSTIFSG